MDPLIEIWYKCYVQKMELMTGQKIEEGFGAALQRMMGFTRPSHRGGMPEKGKT